MPRVLTTRLSLQRPQGQDHHIFVKFATSGACRGSQEDLQLSACAGRIRELRRADCAPRMGGSLSHIAIGSMASCDTVE